MNFNSKARDILIKEIMAALEQDVIPWHKPWTLNANALTDKEYRGVNQVILNLVAITKGYKDTRWCTFKQAKDNNWIVKKDEKGTAVEFWSYYDSVEKKKLTSSEVNAILKKHPEKKDDLRMMAKTYYVFNGSQISNIPEVDHNPTKSETELLDDVNCIVGGAGIPLVVEGTSASYSPTEDKIRIPPLHSFDSVHDYCTTLLHEMAHATGHETRLQRDLTGVMGSIPYAKEELRAEIASAFLSANLNSDIVQPVKLNNHKAYIQSWIAILNNSPNELFAAIKDAEKISDYMIEFCPDKKQEIPAPMSLTERIEVAKSVTKNINAVKTLDSRKDSHER